MSIMNLIKISTNYLLEFKATHKAQADNRTR